jgi:HSP20 family molecular chaperone IbpA
VIILKDDIDDDLMDEIRKFFKINSDLFDVDFFIFPEMDKEKNLEKKVSKGFKISYHYDSELDKPEIKIEGDIDKKKLHEYLKNHNIDPNMKNKKLMPPSPRIDDGTIDAEELSLEPCRHNDNSCIIEPYTEIDDSKNTYEIIFEVPGIESEDIILSFSDTEKKVMLTAKSKDRNYSKDVKIPFKPSSKEYNLEVNNGIAILKFKK